MKKIKKRFALLLVFVMAVSVIPQSAFAAKKKVKLSKKAVTVAVGESVKIQLKNNKKKVKWSITSGKKNVTLSKKKKTGVIIKGKKAGKTKVQAKIGKKKYVCKVTVKKWRQLITKIRIMERQRQNQYRYQVRHRQYHSSRFRL